MKMSDRVVRAIRESIINGEYAAGQRLSTEAEFAISMGVSRTVIRDAFRTLSSMGLVTIRQGDGTYVTEPDDQHVRHALALRLHRSDITMGDVIGARAAMEAGMAYEAALVGNDADWERMQGWLDQFTTAVAEEQWALAHLAHLRFHLGVLEALHEPALSISMQPMHELILVSSLPPEAGRVDLWEVDVHAPILEALRTGDPKAARDAVRAHYDYIDRPEYAEFRATAFRLATSVPSFDEIVDTYRELEKFPVNKR